MKIHVVCKFFFTLYFFNETYKHVYVNVYLKNVKDLARLFIRRESYRQEMTFVVLDVTSTKQRVRRPRRGPLSKLKNVGAAETIKHLLQHTRSPFYTNNYFQLFQQLRIILISFFVLNRYRQ